MSSAPGRDSANDSILIVGTGFSGLGMAIRLKQAGITDFTLLEQADGLGGTWRDNHYPGAACDVQSHLYSFSFEPNSSWTRMFAPQREILEYLNHCADKYGLRPHIRFNTPVARASFEEGSGLWRVESRGGEVFEARVLISGCGGLSRPILPEIRGLDRFEGKVFHSARWAHDFPLEGKVVGVIGTGASAIQIVPNVAPEVRRLHVFQRTAPWIMPKPDRELSAREREVFRRVPAVQKLLRRAIYAQRELLAVGFFAAPRILKLGEYVARKYLEASVPDPALRAKLTPDYSMGCKRVLPTNDYYPALLRENVELVTESIEEITARGVVTSDGKERPVDALILATGFQAAEALAPFEVRGRAGRDLNEAWRDGAEAYLGTTVAGFPNLFLMTGPNTGLGHTSMIFMIESQIQYVLDCIKVMRARRLKSVNVREDAMARYNERLHTRLGRTIWASGCKSWYRTRSGKNTTLWPGFTFEFRYRTRRFDPAAYELT